MANTLKTPDITKDTKILTFDLEANGLHGEVFAVGALVMDAKGNVLDEFTGRCDMQERVDDWVEKNVIPVITDMEVTHSSYKHLRDHFWAWFQKAKENSDYVLVNNGYPVEYGFLLRCQQDDLEERYWQHPFPILDLTSMLVAKGVDARKAKNHTKTRHEAKGNDHHPVYDAKLAALCLFDNL